MDKRYDVFEKIAAEKVHFDNTATYTRTSHQEKNESYENHFKNSYYEPVYYTSIFEKSPMSMQFKSNLHTSQLKSEKHNRTSSSHAQKVAGDAGYTLKTEGNSNATVIRKSEWDIRNEKKCYVVYISEDSLIKNDKPKGYYTS